MTVAHFPEHPCSPRRLRPAATCAAFVNIVHTRRFPLRHSPAAAPTENSDWFPAAGLRQRIIGPENKRNTEFIHILFHGHRALFHPHKLGPGTPVPLTADDRRTSESERFLLLAEILREPQKLLLCFVNQRQILFRHRVGSRLIGQEQSEPIILHGIRTMILNCNIEQK